MSRNNKPRMPDVVAKVTKRVGPLTYLVEKGQVKSGRDTLTI